MLNLRIVAIVFTLLVVFTIFWFQFTHISIIIFPSVPTRSISTSTAILTNSTHITTTTTTAASLTWKKHFHATMSAEQRVGMLALLKIFKTQMEKYNITYFMYGGSLIGVNRHHGFIPWDDDIDILVDSTKKEQLKAALRELNNTHSLRDYQGKETSKWKFYKLDGKPYSHRSFRYPYLDLFFFNEYNKTTFYVEQENELMPKSKIFPLVDKIFDDIVIPTPCDTDGILHGTYRNLNKCSSPSWNHSTEYGVAHSQQLSLNCDLLRPFFPFVERRIEKMADRNYVMEILKQGKTPLQIVTYSTPLICSMNRSRYQSNVSMIKL